MAQRRKARNLSKAARPGARTGKAPANKGRRYPVELLTTEEAQAIIGACSRRAPSGVRNAALIACLWRGALRLSEALALTVKDVDTGTGEVRVLHGKGDKARVVWLDSEGLRHVVAWIERRAALGFNGRHPLFCTLRGEALKPSYVRDMLKRKAARAGIEKRVHPHGFRHLRAAELDRAGNRVTVIRDALGHSSLRTTDTYLRKVSGEEVRRAMAAKPEPTPAPPSRPSPAPQAAPPEEAAPPATDRADYDKSVQAFREKARAQERAKLEKRERKRAASVSPASDPLGALSPEAIRERANAMRERERKRERGKR